MKRIFNSIVFSAVFLSIVPICLRGPCRAEDPVVSPVADRPLSILVTDPLAKELACDCVAGFAQRRYEALAMVLERRLRKPCAHICGTRLSAYWNEESKVDLIIGKHSDVLYQAKQLGRTVHPLASLTNKQGETTFRGLFVVRKGNPAQSLKDLENYRILFGPDACDEKASAAKTALNAANVSYLDAASQQPAASCTDAANQLMKRADDDMVAAVISDYARVLLEGCHTIPPGSIRVVGRTDAIPFVTVFATDELPPEERIAVTRELIAAKKFTTLLKLMETRDGFQPFQPSEEDPAAADADSSKQAAGNIGWTDFRGRRRDGLVPKLPDTLDLMRTLWTARLDENGLGGVAATDRWAIVTDRVAARDGDVLKIFDAQTGDRAVTADLMRPPSLQLDKALDYGNSIRATPVVHDGKVYLLDAYGTLFTCDLPAENSPPREDLVLGVRTESLTDRFKLATWGVAATPLIVDENLVVNVCDAETSLVALDRDDLTPAWRAAGKGTGYASCILGQFGGRRQIVGYQSESFSGWDAGSGELLWNVQPLYDGDFNVPSPIGIGERQLLVATENNGMRLHEFGEDGRLAPEPTAVNEDITPDTVTPVAAGAAAYCTSGDTLFRVDLQDGLKETWSMRDEAFIGHASLIADAEGKRLLVLTYNAELLLFDISTVEPRLLSRRNAFGPGATEEVYSHPAIVGNRLYVRGTNSLCCVAF